MKKSYNLSIEVADSVQLSFDKPFLKRVYSMQFNTHFVFTAIGSIYPTKEEQ
jgi:hypothetical protein